MKSRLFKLLTFIFVFIISLSLTGCDLTIANSNNTTKSTSESYDSITTKEPNAYELAVLEGFNGTYEEWILSMVDTSSYQSVYQLAVESGLFDGTLEEFINSLKGESAKSSTIDATQYALNSTVSIYCTFNITQSYRGWGGQIITQTSQAQSGGSGVIYMDDKENGVAYIITNYHVVYYSGADEEISENIVLYLYGMEYEKFAIPATYIGGSMTYDIAVLKIDSDIYKDSGAFPATIGKSDDIVVGEDILAIGNSKGEGISVTKGIVSVKSESIEMTAADEKTNVSFTVIRIDAAVNSGNSGGGLYDSDGKLIGIVNAKQVNTSVEGMCYAIPIDLASIIADKIISTCDSTTKTIKKVTLGVYIEVYSSKSVYDSSTKTTKIVQEIAVSSVSGGVAEGNLMAGDVISAVTIDGVTYGIDDMYDLERALLRLNKGDSAEFLIYRDSKLSRISITFTQETAVQ